MSYLLPCRPQCLFFTVHRSFPPAFRFQIFHEKHSQPLSTPPPDPPENPHPLSADYSPCTQTPSHAPVQCRYLPSPRYIPHMPPSRTADPPAFARSSTRHISSPSLQIAFIGYPSLISASRQIKTPFIKYTINTTPEQSIPSAAFPPHRYWHPRYPFAHSTTFLRNFSSDHPSGIPCSTKKPLFRFSPQKPIRIQSFS